MDVEAILCHFTATIFAVRVGCENPVLSNGEASLSDFDFGIWVSISQRGLYIGFGT